MPFKVDTRTRETSATIGAGDYALDGAPTDFLPFSGLGANCFTWANVTNDVDFEEGLYKVLAGNQLSRIACYQSSIASAFINWGANSGTKKVRCVNPAKAILPRKLTKATGGGAGTTILTMDEQLNDQIEFTGVLTGDRIIEVDGSVPWSTVLLNSTTGAFTLTFRATGQTGFKVQRARRVLSACDGVDARMVENVVQRKAADVVAAATIDLNVDGDLVDVTGNTGITAVTLEEGREVTVRFTGTPTITNGASLILPQLQNIPMRAGDYASFRGYAAAVVRLERLQRADALTPLPRSYLAGYGLSNNGGDAVNDIDVAVGAVRAATDDGNIILAAAMTKQLDAAWAVGTNAGGRASGAAIANGTYHVFAIRRSDTGVVDIAFDTSATGANIAANTAAAYTQVRRIGSILREGGSIVAFSQNGDEFLRTSSVLDVNAVSPGSAGVTRTLSVPTGVKVMAMVNLNRSNGGTNGALYASPLDAGDEGATFGGAAPIGSVINPPNAQSGNGPHYVRTNTSAQIRTRDSNGAADVTEKLATLGWLDRRGRDD